MKANIDNNIDKDNGKSITNEDKSITKWKLFYYALDCWLEIRISIIYCRSLNQNLLLKQRI